MAAAAAHARRHRRVHRQGRPVPRRLAAHQPADGDLRRGRRPQGRVRPRDGRQPQGAVPDLPRSPAPSRPGTSSAWSASRSPSSTRSPSCCPRTSARRTTCSTSRPRSAWIHAPRRLGPGRCRPQAVPLRGGADHPARARTAPGRASAPRAPGHAPGEEACWPRSTERLPFELTAGPARRRRTARERPRRAAPDEPPPPGRGRLRQDAGRAPRDAAGHRQRGAGGAARAHRGARPAAPPLDQRDARRPRRGRHARRRRRGHQRRAAHRLDEHRPAPRGAAADRQRRGRHRHRHPCAARGAGLLRRPRPGRRRRAAPLRRRAARRPHRQGPGRAARAGDDRDPDPAHRRDDGLRRPRGLDAARAARRPRADPDQRGAAQGPAALARPGLAAGPRGGREGPPGLRRLPADRRRRRRGGRVRPARPDRGGHPAARRARGVAGRRRVPRTRARRGPARRAPGRHAARPDAAGGQGPRHAGLRPRRHRRAGLHDGHRGRRRRRQRHHDRAARRRPVRRLPAPPAPRPGRPGRPARAVPAGQPRRAGQPGDGPAPGGGRHHRRLRAVPDRPRAAPRGRRPRRQPVRACAPASTACGCSATRRPSSRPGPRPRRWSPPTRRSAAGRCSPPRWTSGSRTARVPTWSAHDPDHRRIRRGTAAHDAPRAAHPPDQRPGPRGAVLGDRGLVRLALRPPLPRPVRRLRRGRPRGAVPRRRGGHAGRARPPHRRPHRRQRQDPRVRPGRGARRRAWPAPSRGPPWRRTTWSSWTRPTRWRTPTWRPRCSPWSTTTGSRRGRWWWSSDRSADAAPEWPSAIEPGRDKKYGETLLWYGHARSLTLPPRSRPPCAEQSAPGRSTRSPTDI